MLDECFKTLIRYGKIEKDMEFKDIRVYHIWYEEVKYSVLKRNGRVEKIEVIG
jgi:hypothetical protein